MKNKGKAAPFSSTSPGNAKSPHQRRSENRRRMWLRLAAIIMVIVFLAGECALLIPE